MDPDNESGNNACSCHTCGNYNGETILIFNDVNSLLVLSQCVGGSPAWHYRCFRFFFGGRGGGGREGGRERGDVMEGEGRTLPQPD